jgi:hypothetical protein
VIALQNRTSLSPAIAALCASLFLFFLPSRGSVVRFDPFCGLFL